MASCLPLSGALMALFPKIGLAQDYPLETSPRADYVDVEVQAPAQPSTFSFALGVALSTSPEYAGSNRRDYSLKPIGAVRYGRYKLSTSGGSSVLNFGSVSDSSGASADLINTEALKLKVSARIGGGRATSDSVDLTGLEDIPRTVFARFSVSYALTDHLSANSTVSWDLLERGNGGTLSAGIGYVTRVSANTEWNLGLGITYANDTHMQGMFGVPVASASATHEAYWAKAGLKDVGIGTGVITALNRHWIMFGNVGYSRLLGDAADSPITRGAGAFSAGIGIGYRCCK